MSLLSGRVKEFGRGPCAPLKGRAWRCANLFRVAVGREYSDQSLGPGAITMSELLPRSLARIPRVRDVNVSAVDLGVVQSANQFGAIEDSLSPSLSPTLEAVAMSAWMAA